MMHSIIIILYMNGAFDYSIMEDVTDEILLYKKAPHIM